MNHSCCLNRIKNRITSYNPVLHQPYQENKSKQSSPHLTHSFSLSSRNPCSQARSLSSFPSNLRSHLDPMTTAARPTWAPAKGGNEQGGTRIFGPSQKYSSRDIASHTTLSARLQFPVRFSLSEEKRAAMGVFTFVLNKTGSEWSAKQHSGDIEASAASTFEIQRQLVKAALAVDSSGGVRSSYSPVSPSSAVFQVIVGGAVIVGGGAAAAAPAGGAAPAAAAAPAASKKEEKVEEEEEDDDMGFSLFD